MILKRTLQLQWPTIRWATPLQSNIALEKRSNDNKSHLNANDWAVVIHHMDGGHNVDARWQYCDRLQNPRYFQYKIQDFQYKIEHLSNESPNISIQINIFTGSLGIGESDRAVCTSIILSTKFMNFATQSIIWNAKYAPDWSCWRRSRGRGGPFPARCRIQQIQHRNEHLECTKSKHFNTKSSFLPARVDTLVVDLWKTSAFSMKTVVI